MTTAIRLRLPDQDGCCERKIALHSYGLAIKLLIAFFLLSLIFLFITQLIHYKLKWQHNSNFKDIKTISFVHPFCSDCGGGEKVLWRMIKSLIFFNEEPSFASGSQHAKKIKINIISGKEDNVSELIQKLKLRFGIVLYKEDDSDSNNINRSINRSIQSKLNDKYVLDVELIPLRSGYMLRPTNFLTMLLQILGQIYFSFEIITKVYSDVYCDTTGLPFCYFILKYFGHSKVTAYTHYPFISNEMKEEVENNKPGVHSHGRMNHFKLFKQIKIYYYKLILKLYEFAGNKCLSFAYVNSTWTYDHMKKIWKELNRKEKLKILYPPCSLSLYRNASKNTKRQNIIVSFAQFRREKNQAMQIRILAKLKEKLNIYPGFQDLELHIIGGVRNFEDNEILNNLINISSQLGVKDYVKFLPNGTIEEILEEFSKAKIAIHTMVSEHFGITLIEMMAAGLILVSHNSAGAKDDILIPSEDGNKPGFLVENEDQYVTQIEEILLRYEKIKDEFIPASRKRAEKFSDEAFKEKFLSQLNEFLL